MTGASPHDPGGGGDTAHAAGCSPAPFPSGWRAGRSWAGTGP